MKNPLLPLFSIVETSYNLSTKATTTKVVASLPTRQLANKKVADLRKVEGDAFGEVAKAWSVEVRK